MRYRTSRFTAYDGADSTVWETDESLAQTVAYLDVYPNGTASAVTRDPSTDTVRSYGGRTEAKAQAIIERHLQRLGLTEREDA